MNPWRFAMESYEASLQETEYCGFFRTFGAASNKKLRPNLCQSTTWMLFGKSVRPTGIGAVGSQNVLRDVQQQPGTIGYVDVTLHLSTARHLTSCVVCWRFYSCQHS